MSGQGESLPRELGAYELIARLAAGGMGTVYLGRTRKRLGFVKPVAVKVLHPHLAHDADLVLRFLDEARVASRIQHPNVVQVLDVDHAHDSVFMAMEYVHGASLANVLATRTAVAVDVLATIAHDVLEGLAAAHETTDESGRLLNIVHRDISPQNILVSVRGRSYLADFGIAKAVDSFGITKSNEILGKLGYMSPEQAIGDRVGPRSDLFSFGVVLWEALAGVRLVTTVGGQAVLNRERVRKLAELAPHADARLVAFVERLLSHSEEERPRSARDASKELLAAVTPAPSERVTDWLRVAAASRLDQLDTLLRSSVQSNGRGEAIELAWKLSTRNTPSTTPAAPVASLPSPEVEPTEIVERRPSRDVALPSAPEINETVVLRDSDAARVHVSAMPPSASFTKRSLAIGVAGACVVGATLLLGLRIHRTATPITHALAETPDAATAKEIATSSSFAEAPPAPPLPAPPALLALSSTPRASSRAPAALGNAAPRPTTARPATSCNPPFTYDSLGTKHYIPGCFHGDGR